jgi:hypothetical protein
LVETNLGVVEGDKLVPQSTDLTVQNQNFQITVIGLETAGK